ncbi:MAG: hypothetical protein IKY33_01510 [Clostridia bacterium]|nr:hypothetical protein [Clostridia bacterium]
MKRMCEICGEAFESQSKRKKRCPVCDYMLYKSPLEKRAAKNKPTESALDKLLGEIAEYNREHGTSLSYGQYVAKFGM